MYSRLITALIFGFILFVSCQDKPAIPQCYTITGQIEDMPYGTAYLYALDLNANERADVDSTIIKDGKFFFIDKNLSEDQMEKVLSKLLWSIFEVKAVMIVR